MFSDVVESALISLQAHGPLTVIIEFISKTSQPVALFLFWSSAVCNHAWKEIVEVSSRHAVLNHPVLLYAVTHHHYRFPRTTSKTSALIRF